MKKILLFCIVLLCAVFQSGANAQTLKFDTRDAQDVTIGNDMKWDNNRGDHLNIEDSNIDDSIDINLSYAVDSMIVNAGQYPWYGEVDYDEVNIIAIGGSGINDMKIKGAFRNPEPISMLLLGVSLLCLAGLKRRLIKSFQYSKI